MWCNGTWCHANVCPLPCAENKWTLLFYNCNVKMSNKVKRGLFYTSFCSRRRLRAPSCHAEIQRVIWYQVVIVTSILMSPISTRSVLKLKQNRSGEKNPYPSFSVIFSVSCCGISYSPHLEDVSAVLASSSGKWSPLLLHCCVWLPNTTHQLICTTVQHVRNVYESDFA